MFKTNWGAVHRRPKKGRPAAGGVLWIIHVRVVPETPPELEGLETSCLTVTAPVRVVVCWSDWAARSRWQPAGEPSSLALTGEPRS